VVRLEQAGRIGGSVLDVGCGTGENALYLASRGHTVVGIDRVERALVRARHKARRRGLAVRFLRQDALRLDRIGRTFDAAIDVGLFHTLEDGERPVYAAALREVCAPDGRAYLLCWSERNPWGFGPRRVTRREIRETFTGGWRVEALEPEMLDTKLEKGRVHAWLARLAPLARPEPDG
jgi:SAM-dependent methyltransferase